MVDVKGLGERSREFGPVFELFYTHDLIAGDLGRRDYYHPILSSDGPCWRRTYVSESSFLAITDRLLRMEGLNPSYRRLNNNQSIDIVSVEPVLTRLIEKYSEDVARRLRVLALLDNSELVDLLSTFPEEGQNVTLAYVL